VLLLDEIELHVYLGDDLSHSRRCLCADSGEICYSRPSELVSPRREYQSAHCHENSPRRPFPVLSDAESRSGEKASPERDLVKPPLSRVSPGREFAVSVRTASRLSESS